MTIDFCLPAKNEARILQKNLQELVIFLKDHARFKSGELNSWQISVLINNSIDDSWQVCQTEAVKHHQLIGCQLLTSAGKGGAIKQAWGQSKSDVLVFMDADLAVSLKALDSLVEPILNGKSDLVIGSRFLHSSQIKRSCLRAVISRSYLLLSKLILHHRYTDMQCGFKAISRDLYNRISSYLMDDQWFFDTELVMIAEKCDARILEIPVDWQELRRGKQKSNVKIFSDGLSFLIKLLYFSRRINEIKKY